MAAHDLLPSVKPFRKKHYVQPGVGHYGVFSGTPLADADLSDRAQHDRRERIAIARANRVGGRQFAREKVRLCAR